MEQNGEMTFTRTVPAVLIFDLNNRLVYANKESLRMSLDLTNGLTEQNAVSRGISGLLSRFRDSLSDRIRPEPDNIAVTVIMTEEASYYLQVVPIFDPGDENNPTHIMILVGKAVEKRAVNLQDAGQKFSLSKREVEVLGNIALGYTNHKIADSLCICEYTVKDHIKKIMKKMGVSSRGEILAFLK
jgi:DNA-binding CsgD family transcriptional regulator